MRHHLISFLGTNTYQPCIYYRDDFSMETAFSGRAVHAWVVNQSAAGDAVALSVCLTPGAESKNKTAFLASAPQTPEPNWIAIPEQASDAAFWQIFEALNNAVSDDETVWLDITHSFRYLPMLAYAVLHYLQTVRNIRIGGIFYGAAETLGPLSQWPESIIERRVPLEDLSIFLRVNQWTLALRDFHKSGSSESLRELTEAHSLPRVKSSKGKDSEARALRQLGIALEDWCRNVATCRGNALRESRIGPKLREFIHLIGDEMLPPLTAEFEGLKKRFDKVEEGSVRNIFIAVEWCVEKGLIQQAWTLLQEGIVTYFIEEWNDELDKLCSGELGFKKRQTVSEKRVGMFKRDFVSKLLTATASNIPPVHWHSELKDGQHLAEELQKVIPPELAELYSKISGFRNDINHAGFNPNATNANKLVSAARQLSDAVFEILIVSKH